MLFDPQFVKYDRSRLAIASIDDMKKQVGAVAKKLSEHIATRRNRLVIVSELTNGMIFTADLRD